MCKDYIVGGIRERDSSVCIELIAPDGNVQRCRLTPKLWNRYTFSSGDIISEDIYREIASESERCEAVTRAVRILSGSPCSASALFGKLRRAGYSAESSEAAVQTVLRRGLINEVREASRYAQNTAVRSRRGPARIIHDLILRGYPRDVAREAASSVPAEVYDAVLCELISRKCPDGVPSDRYERERLIASLVRAGFGSGDIMRAIAHLGADRSEKRES